MYAPIVMFVYNRPWHSAQTLDALMKNEHADKSTLYIFADAAKMNSDQASLEKVAAVKSLIQSKQWCKEVIIIEAAENKGLAASIISGITSIFEKHDRLIVLEDDIVPSPHFLSFMNAALDYYEQDERVFGVSGFSYPSTVKPTNAYCLPIACSWSWATWRSRWSKVNFDTSFLLKQIQEQQREQAFDFGNYPFFRMLNDQLEGKINSWAIRFYASMFLQDGLFIYPPSSLVANIGFDHAASHTHTADGFFDRVKPGEQAAIQFGAAQLDENAEAVRLKFVTQFGPQQNTVLPQRWSFQHIIKKVKQLIR